MKILNFVSSKKVKILIFKVKIFNEVFPVDVEHVGNPSVDIVILFIGLSVPVLFSYYAVLVGMSVTRAGYLCLFNPNRASLSLEKLSLYICLCLSVC